VSFGSEPGRDDGGLPPVNIVIPDDARELDRDVLAYRREQRARRRRERFLRLLRPFRGDDLGGHSTILPLIATCVALSMLAGAMLSVVTISPASAPTVSPSATAPGTGKSATVAKPPPSMATPIPARLAELPPGTFTVDGKTEQVRTLRSAALALVPPNCACDKALGRLAAAAGAARVGLYFVGEGGAIPQIPALTTRDGRGVAAAAADTGNVLRTAYRPAGLTVVLVYSDGISWVRRGIPATFQFPSAPLHALTLPGR
jgi:hypothetical protein